jgi:transcriptional regulator with XRE-family HTH domain
LSQNINKSIKTIGETLQLIRKNKNIKIKDAYKGLSRTKYYNIEHDNTQPSYADLMTILDNLKIDFAEFEFLKNGSQSSKRVQLLNRFQTFGHSLNPQKADNLINDLNDYGTKHNDQQILNLSIVLKAISILTYEEDLASANKLVAPVWEKLKKQDFWFLYDIVALNNMLFHFNDDDFKIYIPRLLQTVTEYEGMLDAKRATVLVNVNIAYGLRQQNKFKASKPYLLEAIKHAESYNLIMYYDLQYKLAEVLYVEGQRGEANRLAIESFDMLVSLKKTEIANDNRKEFAQLKEKYM